MWLWLPVLLEDGHSTVSVGIGISIGIGVSILVSKIMCIDKSKDTTVCDLSDRERVGAGIGITPPVL